MLRGDSTNMVVIKLDMINATDIHWMWITTTGVKNTSIFRIELLEIPAFHKKLRTVNYISSMTGWWFGTCFFSIQLGFSSSQLTHIFQRGGPTTR